MRTIALITALVTLVACDRSAVEPEVAPGLKINEIIMEDAMGNVIFSHYDHWHGSPTPRMGQTVTYTMHFATEQMSPDDHNALPREKWFSLGDKVDLDLRTVVSDQTVANWSGDKVRGTLTGMRDASTQLSFVVRRATATIYEAPPLTFRVRP